MRGITPVIARAAMLTYEFACVACTGRAATAQSGV
jgi:hypothetical protein